VASAAARALTRLGGAAQRAVVSALPSADSARRAVLLRSVPARPEIAAATTPCLDDPDPQVRALACEALARAGAVDAVPALFALLDDPDPRVGQAAAAAIQALGRDDTEPLTLAAARSPSTDPLLAAVADPDARVREAATQSLALVDDPRAVAELVATASSPDPRARASAVRALGEVPGAASVQRVEAALEDPDPWVRYYACQALGRLGERAALGSLVRRLADEAGQVRIAVIDALARLPAEPEARSALLEAAASRDPEVRRSALLGLGNAGVEEGLPLVLAAVADPDPVGFDAAPARRAAIAGISALGGPGAREVLEPMAARDPDPQVRSLAVHLLGRR
jgi:HEAT repeat protein